MVIAELAIIKKAWAEIKKSSVQLFQGEITISKRECWMIGTILVLAGIALGLINAPLTHGVNVSIGSNNGNDNGNGNGNNNGNAPEGDKAAPADGKDGLCEPETPKADKKKCEHKKKCRHKKRRL